MSMSPREEESSKSSAHARQAAALRVRERKKLRLQSAKIVPGVSSVNAGRNDWVMIEKKFDYE